MFCVAIPLLLRCCPLTHVMLCVCFCEQVYVEFDDQEWEKREWVKVYEDFQLFLLQHQLVWAKRKEGGGERERGGGGGGCLIQGTKAKHIQWPALVSSFQSTISLCSLTFFYIGRISRAARTQLTHHSQQSTIRNICQSGSDRGSCWWHRAERGFINKVSQQCFFHDFGVV